MIFGGCAEERLELSLTTGQNKLFISNCSINVTKIQSGSEDSKLKSFLNQCKLVHQQSLSQTGSKASMRTRPGRSGRDRTRDTVQRSSSSSLESREAAKIASKTYEAIQQRKMTNGETVTHLSPRTSLSNKPQPHSSKRPLSDIYVTGASSFTDLSTTRSEHEEMVRRYQPWQHSSAESLEGAAFGYQHAVEPHSQWSRQSCGYDSDSCSVSTNPTLLRSHSQGSIPGDAGPSLGLTYGAISKTRSLTRSIDSVNTPTFEPPSRSSSAVFRRFPSYSRLDSGSSTAAAVADELASQVAELEEKIGLLATQFLYERHDMFKQIHAACEFTTP